MNKILIADSSMQNTGLISYLLESNNYETMTAESGRNALAKVNIFKPDLVVLDLDLPDLSGYDVCKKLKSNPETKYIMVLCMATTETRDIRTRLAEVDADDFIEKSFDRMFFLSKIKSLLNVKNLNDQLTQKFRELEEKNNILEFQLRMGQKVQRSLMPDVDLHFANTHVISRYLPALDIGGDFYNIIKLNPESIGILIGDVSGHGISAALLTAMFNTMIVNLTRRYYNPDQVLFYLNSEFCKAFENTGNEIYACMFYAVINTQKRVIYYSNAGQALPILVHSQTSSAIELESSGMPIGIIENSNYEFKSISYQPGDLLFLHTDGLTDTFYKERPDEFSTRLKNDLQDAFSMEPDEIADIVLSEFYNFNPTKAEKLAMDDVSIVICKL